MKGMALMIWVLAAALAAFGLFHVKHEISAIEEELADVRRSIMVRREAIHILEAEWSYLNQPSRIAELARRHLNLAPMTPEQVLGMAQLPYRRHRTASAGQLDAAGLSAEVGRE